METWTIFRAEWEQSIGGAYVLVPVGEGVDIEVSLDIDQSIADIICANGWTGRNMMIVKNRERPVPIAIRAYIRDHPHTFNEESK